MHDPESSQDSSGGNFMRSEVWTKNLHEAEQRKTWHGHFENKFLRFLHNTTINLLNKEMLQFRDYLSVIELERHCVEVYVLFWQ